MLYNLVVKNSKNNDHLDLLQILANIEQIIQAIRLANFIINLIKLDWGLNTSSNIL